MTASDLRDWDVLTAEFRRRTVRLQRHRVRLRPGVNMMTPEILGTFQDIDGDLVEVSTGTGLYGERIFGLTYADLADGSRHPGSHLETDLDAVIALIGGDE